MVAGQKIRRRLRIEMEWDLTRGRIHKVEIAARMLEVLVNDYELTLDVNRRACRSRQCRWLRAGRTLGY
jgi:hypothetical protein